MVKRQRLSAEELRDRMLDTAKSMIADAGGLTVSLAHLSMEEIIRAAGVPRSSVYREWAAREDFYVDLMVELSVDDGPADKVFDQATLDTAFAVLDSLSERLRDPQARWPVAREMIRRAVARNVEAVTVSPAWRTVASMTAMMTSLDETGQRVVRDAISRVEGQQLTAIVAFLAGVIPRLGMRMKRGFTVEQLAVCASSVVSGMVRRSLSSPEVVSTTVPYPGAEEVDVEWPLTGLAYLAIVEFMVEIDPDWAPRGTVG